MTLEFTSVSVQFGAVTAVRNVTASAQAGRVTMLLGPNGAGKSTLLRAAIGAVPVSSGEIAIDTQSVHDMPASQIARRFAYVSARPSTWNSYTVREVVELGRFRQVPDSKRIEAVLRDIELFESSRRPVSVLSTGQQQRVAVARALVQLDQPGFLLLDEPFSAMDIRHRQQVWKMLDRCIAFGHGVVIAMHSLHDAMLHGDDAWLMRGGSLIHAGAIHEILNPERLESVFGVPFHMIRIDQTTQIPVEREPPRRSNATMKAS